MGYIFMVETLDLALLVHRNGGCPMTVYMLILTVQFSLLQDLDPALRVTWFMFLNPVIAPHREARNRAERMITSHLICLVLYQRRFEQQSATMYPIRKIHLATSGILLSKLMQVSCSILVTRQTMLWTCMFSIVTLMLLRTLTNVDSDEGERNLQTAPYNRFHKQNLPRCIPLFAQA